MSKFVVQATWDDVPHLTAEAKQELLAQIPKSQRDARTRGIPQIGSGAIFAIPENEIVVNDFPIPYNWPRAYGMSVGWDKTAAVWGARDDANGIVYLYSEHYREQDEPLNHAARIMSRGDWIPGTMDTATTGNVTNQADGKKLLAQYIQLGLKLTKAESAVEAGIVKVVTLLTSGKLKVFRGLNNWWAEFRTFSRDEKGQIKDAGEFHLMASTRFLAMTGLALMCAKPVKRKAGIYGAGQFREQSWMCG